MHLHFQEELRPKKKGVRHIDTARHGIKGQRFVSNPRQRLVTAIGNSLTLDSVEMNYVTMNILPAWNTP